jgi:tetratricopeptide (TPR) repeat protein
MLCLTALLFASFFALAPSQGQLDGLQSELRSAVAAEQAGQYEKAAALYQRIAEQADGELQVQARTRLATDYFLLHRYTDSLQAVEPLTQGAAVPSRLPAQAWLVEGLDYLELDHPARALAPLRQALALNPDSGTARLALGDALARTHRFEEALSQYQEQTRRTPQLPDAWYKLGLTYQQLAAQTVKEVAKKFPASTVAEQLAAEEALANEDYLAAAKSLYRLVRRAPQQPQVHADLGFALLNLGFPKVAEEQFRAELSQDPYCPLALLGRAVTESLRGDQVGAVASVKQLIDSNPHEASRLLASPPPVALRQAWASGKVRISQQLAASPAAQLWMAWLRDSGTTFTPPAALPAPCVNPPSQPLEAPGVWLPEACYQSLRQRLGRKKRWTQIERLKLAEAELRLGNYQQARHAAQLALASDPSSDWAMFWLHQANGRLADDMFLKVASLNPESPRVHEMLARYYAHEHDVPRAKAEYSAAIRAAPDLPDLHLGLGTLYWGSGEWEEAEKELQRTLELMPGSVRARFELGDAYVQQGRWQEAIRQLQQVRDDPGVGLKARLDLAKAEEEMGQLRQAIEVLAPAASQDTSGEVHYRLAALYRKLGDKAHAQQALATFKKLRDASLAASRQEAESLDKETAEQRALPSVQ